MRQQWMTILAILLVVLLAAAALTLLAPKTYRASVQLFVTATTESPTNPFADTQFAQGEVKSFAQIVNSPLVTEPVIRDLALNESSDDLAAKISTDVPVDTSVLDIWVEDTVPDRAAKIANAVAKQLMTAAPEIEKAPGATDAPVKVTVVKSATAPSSPVSPSPVRNLALALVLGLGAGIGLSLLRDRVRASPQTGQELEENLGLATIGVIPVDKDARARPLVTPEERQSPYAEALRRLRSMLKYADAAQGLRSIVVTSSLPDEGASTITSNLAIMLAETGMRVALVDANLRRPHLARYLGASGEPGLTDVLGGGVELAQALQPWRDADSLRVLTSGRTVPNPGDILDSPQMIDLLQRLQNEFDAVLLAVAPVLSATEALGLCAIADRVLLVVQAGRTPLTAVRQALTTLRGVDAPLLGAVLNGVHGSEYRRSASPETMPTTGRHSSSSGVATTFDGLASRSEDGSGVPHSSPPLIGGRHEDALPENASQVDSTP